MKVLINAYACRPNAGSEAGMAWNWITGFAAHDIETFVITEGEWKNEIEKALSVVNNSHLIHFFFNPVSDKIRRMCWNQGDYRFYIYYKEWQKRTLEIAKDIVQKYKIDIIHQLNMIGFREPGYLWSIDNIPYVWGPIGGMNIVPMQYLNDAPFSTRMKYKLKNVVTKYQYKHHPRVLNAIERSSALITANKFSYDVLASRYPQKEVVLINETGCSGDIEPSNHSFESQTFNILWVGRFIPTKLMELSLKVIESIKHLDGIKFHIIGKAFNEEDTQKYHNMAEQMGISELCEWHGWVSHDEVQRLMQSSDVFFFPSVVEGTPHVVLEAIANHLPVVCFDTCGQGDAVNDTVGIKVPLSNPLKSVSDFAKALTMLYNDRIRLKALSDACSLRKKELSWGKKVEEVIAIYKKVTPPHAHRYEHLILGEVPHKQAA